jgi:hypothetical protein
VADAPGTLELIARELATALTPLEQQLAAGNAEAFLRELGIVLPGAFGQAADAVGDTAVRAAALVPLVADLVAAIEAEDGDAIVRALLPLLTAIAQLVDAIRTLEPAFTAALAAASGLSPAQKAYLQDQIAALPGRLLDRMVIDYLEARFSGLAAALTTMRIIDDVLDPGDLTDPVKPPLRRRELRLDRLVTLVTAPDAYLDDAYHFGRPDFDGMLLFKPLADFLDSIDFAVDLLIPPGAPPILEAYVLRLSTDPATSPPNLTARLRVPASQDVSLTIPLGGAWSFVITVGARFDAGIGVDVTPAFELRLVPPTGSITVDAAIGLKAEHPPQPMILLGQAGGSRLELQSFTATVGVEATAGTGQPVNVEPSARVAITGGRLVIDLSQADGFIGTIAGGVRIDSNVDLAARWSPSSGLSIEGSGAIEIAVPTHVSLGPIEIDQLYLRATIGSDASIPVELSGAFSASLGPMQAAVDRIGAIATFSFPPDSGNLGKLDLAFAFKPPTGVGLAVDAGVVSGGGFLSIDAQAGEYAGALELEFANFLSLKAIGLITTRMPDGSTGFSLLVVITAEFPGGLQLGYGFTLLGVGGILGLNRGMRLSALMEGVRTGAIESVMFPHDVVANAPRILSDLKAFFPAEQGRFVIGPMAKLGWGTPTLVSVSLGVIIEIPGNIAILGVLKVALPTEDEAVLLLQVNFAGAIEFDKRRLYFFAALFQSRVLTITIEGEMGLLVAFGDQPDFVLSVGGFHPAFKAPPLPFPSPKRISLNLLNTDVARIGVQGYFAVTSNTAQFGAKAELFFGFSSLSVQGHLGFDALFQFSPFRFVVAISAGVSVKVFGIGLFSVSLDVTLTGPTPWQISGTASISLLFFSIGVDVDVTWGEERDTSLPPVSVLPLLADELTKPESWRTRSPVGGSPLVSLRALEGAEADVILHPVGTLVVQQRVVPLDITVDKVGSQRSADVSGCSVAVTTGGLVKVSDAVDNFALAQFQELSAAQKLSLPAFEREHAGVELAPDGAAMASFRAVRRSARYEQVVIDTPGREPVGLVSYNPTLFGHFLGGASITRSPLAQAERNLRQPFRDAIRVPGEAYVVASTRDNAAASAVFTSNALARAHLDALLTADPNQVDELHVIPAMEVAP